MGRNALRGKPGFRRWLLSWTTVTRSLLPDGSGPRKFIKVIVGRGPGGRGGMVSIAGRRLRPLPRAAFILTALLGCGLLASACSEAPKLAKAPTSQPTSTSEEKASPPPAANKPDGTAQPTESESAKTEQSRELNGAGTVKKRKYSRRYESEPGAGAEPGAPGTSEPSYDAEGAAGGAAPEAPSDEPRAAGESGAPMQPEMPSGGAAPPSDMTPSPPPPPPASMGQGAPPPTSAPP